MKVTFPVKVNAVQMMNEIQYGYVERPVYRSEKVERNKMEVCNHRYTALAEGKCGMAVLNDCKYGVSAEGNEISLSLLRASMSPQVDLDRGQHTFSYGVTFWNSAVAESNLSREAFQFNVPIEVASGMGAYSAMRVDANNILLDTMKLAEDQSGDIIVRLYESLGSSTKAGLFVYLLVEKAWFCDLLENRQGEIPVNEGKLDIDFGCFQVRTIRLKLK